MNKKLLYIALLLIATIAAGFIAWAVLKPEAIKNGQTIQEFSGKIVCLTQINGQDICAYGLQTSDNKQYALDSTPEATDYNLAIKNYPAGSSVVVKGTLSTSSNNQKFTNYTTDGVISAVAIRSK